MPFLLLLSTQMNSFVFTEHAFVLLPSYLVFLLIPVIPLSPFLFIQVIILQKQIKLGLLTPSGLQ